MTINYKGMSKDFDYRVAEINYDEENEKEVTLMNRLVFWLERVKGYSVENAVAGYAVVEVENREEYKQFKADYLVGKKMIKDCMKYGF